MKKMIPRIAALAVAALVIPACGKSSSSGTPVTYVQIEQLARPAINEGLFHTNDFLNAYNTLTPAQQGGALTGAIATEAVNTLNAFAAYGVSLGFAPPPASVFIGALIPDVMRIDTTVASGYVAEINSAGSPVSGRKITDDVMSETISYLVAGNPNFGTTGVTDNVTYAGANIAQGHHALLGTFPYLAKPN